MSPTPVDIEAPESTEKRLPPGKVKIMEALRTLLVDKEFASITIAEIAQTAGVTEGLIYKYFKDKRDLLHSVLADYVDFFIARMVTDLQDVAGPLNRLRKVIEIHLTMYASNRVFARILLLEVRNHPDYFHSEAYKTVKRYIRVIEGIIEKGVAEGAIRDDIPVDAIMRMIHGSIEHSCLPTVLFQTTIDPVEASDLLCKMIFQGITKSRD